MAKRALSEISEIIIHCADTPNGNPHYEIADIDRWHRANGWGGVGYHWVIHVDGAAARGRDLEEVGTHCAGHNRKSIGICLIGRDKFTREQWLTLESLVRGELRRNGDLAIHGHREFSNKECPGFAVGEWLNGGMQPLEAHLCPST